MRIFPTMMTLFFQIQTVLSLWVVSTAATGWLPSKPNFHVVGGDSSSPPTGSQVEYGRVSDDCYLLTPSQIESFHRDGCITLKDVLQEHEVDQLSAVFQRFVSGEIKVPGKDFCDMSQPFGTPYEKWNLVNCMLPTTYYPPLQGNVYERLTDSIAQQLFDGQRMQKDYDQFLNKRPGKTNAVFSWHQDMAYWPGPEAINVSCTDTSTFSLALDDSFEDNGCLRYIAGSGCPQKLRQHRPLTGNSRDDGHALTTDLLPDDVVTLAPASKGSITIHNEWVVHGSGGNHRPDKERRTYVVAYRNEDIVHAERRIGFTHSHNDKTNWDTFNDGASHRVNVNKKD